MKRLHRVVGLGLTCLVVGVGCGAAGGDAANDEPVEIEGQALSSSHRPKPVIVDTDLDVDDTVALSYLCAEHKLGHIDLRAVTVTNNGAGYPGKAIKHARCVLRSCGLPDVPVADASLPAPNQFPAAIRDSDGQILDNVFAGCTESEAPSSESAPDLLARTLRASTEKVVVLTLGPMSNVAAALAGQDDPPLKRFIDEVVTMGGAAHVPGNLCCGVSNVFDNTQEFNMWVDPVAVMNVSLALDPLQRTWVPLDATNFVPVTQSFADRLLSDHHTPEADVVAAIVADPGFAASIPMGFRFWWDPVAAVSILHRDVVSFEQDKIAVVETGPEAGRLIIAPDGRKEYVGIRADQSQFEMLLLDVLNER